MQTPETQRATDCELRTKHYPLRTTDYGLPITTYPSLNQL